MNRFGVNSLLFPINGLFVSWRSNCDFVSLEQREQVLSGETQIDKSSCPKVIISYLSITSLTESNKIFPYFNFVHSSRCFIWTLFSSILLEYSSSFIVETTRILFTLNSPVIPINAFFFP